MLQVTGRRWKAARVLIAPTRVQGAGADLEVAAALELANRVNGVDVIIVAHGGGSIEDLWTFNEESVVRTIAGSRLPVVSAVGHEIDVTLADLAADQRALTPSEAGEVSVPDAREVLMHLDRLAERLRSASTAQLKDARIRLEDLASCATGWRSNMISSIAAIVFPGWPQASTRSIPWVFWHAATASRSRPTEKR